MEIHQFSYDPDFVAFKGGALHGPHLSSYTEV